MPCQLTLAQGKKPAFPDILANIKNTSEYISTDEWNTYVWYTLNNKISLQLPTYITIIGFYMSNYPDGDVGYLYDFYLSTNKVSPPGMSSSSSPSDYASNDYVASPPTNTSDNYVDPVPNFGEYPYDEFQYISAFMNDTVPYWMPNSNYYVSLVYNTYLQPSSSQPTISPPVNILFTRLLVVQP